MEKLAYTALIKDIERWNNELNGIASSIIKDLEKLKATSSNEIVRELLSSNSNLLKYLNLDSSPFSDNLDLRKTFEIEGSEEFIAKYNETIDSFLEKIYSSDSIQNNTSSTSEVKVTGNITAKNRTDSGGLIEEDKEQSFGEWYNKLPNTAKDVDKILLAGYFVQLESADGIFSTREASNLLVEQGVKLSNASAFMKSNMSTKKVFKHKGGYRVSDTGVSYIKNNLQMTA